MEHYQWFPGISQQKPMEIKEIQTTSSSWRPRGAVMMYDTPECSFAASAVSEGISCKHCKSNQSYQTPQVRDGRIFIYQRMLAASPGIKFSQDTKKEKCAELPGANAFQETEKMDSQ